MPNNNKGNIQNFTLGRAIDIAKKAHIGQVDKAAEPYINHPLAVMEQLEGDEAKTVGVLHDVVEDTDVTFEDLEKMGCPSTIITALRLVTHTKDYKGTEKEYMKKIQKIADSGNQLAIDVKWADLTNNSDISRLPHPKERDFQRLEKYQRSKKILQSFISDYLKTRFK